MYNSMFRRIVLDNFLSFNHIELNLIGKKDMPLNHVLIYGENGSGKTNLLSSVLFLRHTLNTIITMEDLESIDADARHGVPNDNSNVFLFLSKAIREGNMTGLQSLSRRFMLVGCREPMHLLYEFQIDGRKGSYELEFDAQGNVTQEELRHTTGGGGTGRYFRIESSPDGPVTIFGRGILGSEFSKTVKQRIDRVWGKHTALAIIKTEYMRNNSSFMDNLAIGGMRDVLEFLEGISIDVKRPRITTSIRNGIPFQLDRGKVRAEDGRMIDAHERALSSFFIRLYSDIKDVYYKRTNCDGDTAIEYELMIVKEIAGERREIPSLLESAGTKKLLALFPALMACSIGGVAFIDELDSGVHDKMVHDLMMQILPCMKGQLVLTTHNTLLLETANPANVFVLKVDRHGFKEVVSIKDIVKTQKNNNNRDRYLSGLFEGIPYIRELDLCTIASQLQDDIGGGSWVSRTQ